MGRRVRRAWRGARLQRWRACACERCVRRWGSGLRSDGAAQGLAQHARARVGCGRSGEPLTQRGSVPACRAARVSQRARRPAAEWYARRRCRRSYDGQHDVDPSCVASSDGGSCSSRPTTCARHRRPRTTPRAAAAYDARCPTRLAARPKLSLCARALPQSVMPRAWLRSASVRPTSLGRPKPSRQSRHARASGRLAPLGPSLSLALASPAVERSGHALLTVRATGKAAKSRRRVRERQVGRPSKVRACP